MDPQAIDYPLLTSTIAKNGYILLAGVGLSQPETTWHREESTELGELGQEWREF